ncbi:unnamed protein product [Boreogadus saida]
MPQRSPDLLAPAAAPPPDRRRRAKDDAGPSGQQGAALLSCPPCHAVAIPPSNPYRPPQLAALRSSCPPAPPKMGM